MAEKTEFLQAIDDAILDADSLERFINGDDTQDVLTRLSAKYPTLQKALKELFENGGIAGRFKTLADLQASSLPEGSYALVADDVTGDNGIYIKESGAWVKSKYDIKRLLNDNISIALDKTFDYFVEKSYNLYNHKAALRNTFINTSGQTEASTSGTYSASDFIAVDPLQKYTITGVKGKDAFINGHFYDENKNWLRAIYRTNETEAGPRVITIDEDAYYIRLNINQGAPDENDRMIVKGDRVLPYQEYFEPRFNHIRLNNKHYDDIQEKLNAYYDTSDVIVKSKNLYNPDAVTRGYYLTGVGELVKSETGTWHVTDYIPILSSTEYTLSGGIPALNPFAHLSYYDDDKNHINRVALNPMGGNPYTITTPSNARFVRLNLEENPASLNRMFEIGAVHTNYDTFGKTLDNVELSQSIKNQLKSDASKYIIDLPIDTVFNTDKQWESYTSFGSEKTNNVYAMYDALMGRHSDIISKKNIGNASNGAAVYSYSFKPKRARSTLPLKRPKVFILGGLHGVEHTPVLITYLMMSEMYDNWKSNALLEALRFNVEFIIIPVANPHGFDNLTYGNANGVNLNRNFPTTNWEKVFEGEARYSGPSAGSEPETQNIVSVFTDNPDIDVFYDHHSFGSGPGETKMIWLSSEFPSNVIVEEIGSALIGRMTRKWQSEFAWINQDENFHAGITASGVTPGAGLSATYAHEAGVPINGTFELCDRWWVNPALLPYSQEHCKTQVEALINLMLMTLEQLKK